MRKGKIYIKKFIIKFIIKKRCSTETVTVNLAKRICVLYIYTEGEEREWKAMIIKVTLSMSDIHIPPRGKKVYRAILLATTNNLVEDYGYRFTRERSIQMNSTKFHVGG